MSKTRKATSQTKDLETIDPQQAEELREAYHKVVEGLHTLAELLTEDTELPGLCLKFRAKKKAITISRRWREFFRDQLQGMRHLTWVRDFQE